MAINRRVLYGTNLPDIITKEATGAAAIAMAIAPGFSAELIDIRIKMATVPTTSQALTVTINSESGAMYDTEIYRKDLSALSDGSVIIIAGEDEFVIEDGGSWDIAYTNTDAIVYGVQVRYRRKT